MHWVNLHGRRGARTLATLMAVGALALSPTVRAADGEVELDVVDHKAAFSRRLTYDETFKIAVRLPTGSRATLEYWPRKPAETCDTAYKALTGTLERLRLTVRFPSESAPDKDFTLTTTLGVLDPGASGAAQLTKLLKTSDISPVTTLFYAGTESGEALIRATIGTATVEKVLRLYNETAPLATVSRGIDVHVRTCIVGDAMAADPKVDVQKVVRTGAPTDGAVKTKLRLNALGERLVNEVGGEQSLQVHAYVVADGETTPEIPEASTCVAIQDALAGVAARDVVTLILRRKTM